MVMMGVRRLIALEFWKTVVQKLGILRPLS